MQQYIPLCPPDAWSIEENRLLRFFLVRSKAQQTNLQKRSEAIRCPVFDSHKINIRGRSLVETKQTLKKNALAVCATCEWQKCPKETGQHRPPLSSTLLPAFVRAFVRACVRAALLLCVVRIIITKRRSNMCFFKRILLFVHLPCMCIFAHHHRYIRWWRWRWFIAMMRCAPCAHQTSAS